MDALRAELERRRAETNRLKQKAGVAVAAKGRKRFVRRGDLERARRQEAEEAIAKANAEDMRRRYKVAGAVDEKGRPVLSVQPGDGESRRSKKRRRGGDGEGDSTLPPSSPAASPSVAAGVPDSPASPAMALSREAAILRLRVIGQPITCVGTLVCRGGGLQRSSKFRRLHTLTYCVGTTGCLESLTKIALPAFELQKQNGFVCGCFLWVQALIALPGDAHLHVHGLPMSPSQAETAADEDMRLGAGHDIVSAGN